MTVILHIHPTHRVFTGGSDRVEVQGQTVGACLDHLTDRFPDIKRVLFSTSGELLKNIDLYVNRKSAYPEELDTPVSDGDEIYLHLLLTGG